MTDQETSMLDLSENMVLEGVQHIFKMYRSRIDELESAITSRNKEIDRLTNRLLEKSKECSDLLCENKELAHELTNCQDLLKRWEEPTDDDIVNKLVEEKKQEEMPKLPAHTTAKDHSNDPI